MNHSPAQVLGQYMIDQGLFGSDRSADWALFVGSLPDKPTRCACVYDTAGMQDGRSIRSGQLFEHPGCQLRGRGGSSDYELGFQKMNDAHEELSLAQNVWVYLDSSVYVIQNISATSTIIPLGMEPGSTRRMGWTCNFILTLSLEDES